jgi:hypothetical protein
MARPQRLSWVSQRIYCRAKLIILLTLFVLRFSFTIFCPKIACQAPKPSKPNKPQEIQDEKSSTQSAIIKTVEKKRASSVGIEIPSGALLIWNEDFTHIADTKTQENQDFTLHVKPKVKA